MNKAFIPSEVFLKGYVFHLSFVLICFSSLFFPPPFLVQIPLVQLSTPSTSTKMFCLQHAIGFMDVTRSLQVVPLPLRLPLQAAGSTAEISFFYGIVAAPDTGDMEPGIAAITLDPRHHLILGKVALGCCTRL